MSNTYAYGNGNPVRYSDPLGLRTCGSGWNEKLVPDNPLGYTFTDCCEKHDECYDDCDARPSQMSCDDGFLDCMMKECRKWGEPVLCSALAKKYHAAVKKHGKGAFEDARRSCPDHCGTY